ncbi:beta-propeller domain-containing protein [Spirillospora sp. CA-294931]|uniref:beta-propeller domain-containing protein n=1 Tax=Spirillospora sp. CA-294931 TaxID=3240042 RepID=UPI003D8A01CB
MRARTYGPLIPAAATLTLIAGCAGSTGRDGDAVDAPPMRLVSYSGCDDLLGGLRSATERQVGPFGLHGSLPPGAMADSGARGAAPNAAPGSASKEQSGTSQHSGTNVHEVGTDEPDQVKTDGRRIVALAGDGLRVIDAASRKVTGRLALTDPDRPGRATGQEQLLLSGDRALVIERGYPRYARSSDTPAAESPVPSQGPQTRLTLVDLSGAPKVLGSMTTRSDYLDARQNGSIARVVVKSSPQFTFPRLPNGRTPEKQATERNRKVVRSAPLEAWLPKIEVRNGSAAARQYSVPCEQVHHPESQKGTSMLTVLTLDLNRELGDPSPVTVAAEGQTVYGNGSSLYVTGSDAVGIPFEGPGRGAKPASEPRTDIHKFSIGGASRPRYVASGSVKGSLLNQYSMSEYEGHLRVATTSRPVGFQRPDDPVGTERAPRSQSTLHILKQKGSALTPTGKVDGLGKGERIYSVRFIGPTAYVVTFRQVDPLYVLDVKNPASPRVTGELKINGYSAYLHPAADGKLIGVGQDADSTGSTKGTQVSLFDVSSQPRRVGAFQLPGTSASSDFEPHAFLYWPKSGLTVIPVRDRMGDGSEALVLKIDGTGVHKQGTIKHPGSDYTSAIQRSLVIGDTLWTLSPNGIQATPTNDLKSHTWLAL